MPKIPEQILGHEKQCGQLLLDIARGNVSHAYLFSGPRHIGKFTLARWFALHLLCDRTPPENHHTTHAQMEKLIHPDFLCLDSLWIADVQENWSEIAKTSNVSQAERAKDGARTDTIGIEEVRALQQRLIETGDSRHLCCLIRSIERMHQEAGSAFLKILEEPPPRVVFLLTTESLSSLLPTLVSRTRVLTMKPLPSGSLRPLVSEAPAEDRDFILHLAQGAPGTVFRLLENADDLRREKQIHAHAKQFWQSRSLKDRLQWITGMLKEQENIDPVVAHLGVTLGECALREQKPAWLRAYLALLNGLKTNAHRGLLFERFALALE